MKKEVEEKLAYYPAEVRKRLNEIRELIFVVADEERIGEVIENLKWGEPSYSVKKGSPIGMGWKSKKPNRYISIVKQP